MRIAPLAALLVSLAFASPAFAQVQAEQTVGAPTVITDPSSQVDTTAPAAPAPATTAPQQDSEIDTPTDTTPPPLHVTADLIGHRPALGSATTTSSAPSAATSTAHTTPVATTTATRATPKGQLPFTGIAAWQIALIGLMLLGSGAALWRLGDSRP